MLKITCLGAGSWGLAISHYLSKKEPNFWLWEGVEQNFKRLKESRQDSARLTGLILPSNIHIVSDLAEALLGCEVLLFILPSHTIEEVARKVAPFIKSKMLLVILSKGLTPTLERISEVLKRTLPPVRRFFVALESYFSASQARRSDVRRHELLSRRLPMPS